MDEFDVVAQSRARDAVDVGRRETLCRMPYRDYLWSPEWRRKRAARLRVDCYRCTECGSRDNLNVHHLTYDNRGDERMGDLVTLCGACHSKLHSGKE